LANLLVTLRRKPHFEKFLLGGDFSAKPDSGILRAFCSNPAFCVRFARIRHFACVLLESGILRAKCENRRDVTNRFANENK
jgi:hypothetical protein